MTDVLNLPLNSKRIRQLLGLTVKDVADGTGYSEDTIKSIECGRLKMSPEIKQYYIVKIIESYTMEESDVYSIYQIIKSAQNGHDDDD